MPRRLAACETCRKAKVACDHATPRCSRCQQDSPGSPCVYRARPFKKKKIPSKTSQHSSRYDVDSPTSAVHMSTRSQYPNPGYLGSSSHDTIFKRLGTSTQDLSYARPLSVAGNEVMTSATLASSLAFKRALWTVEQACECLDFDLCSALITQWLNTGLNLALAGPFAAACAENAAKKLHDGASQAGQICHELFANSARLISARPGSGLVSYCENFCSVENIRWETVGIFFVSLSRAINDSQSFEPLFRSREERRRLQRLALTLADECLEAVTSLDCLNDLQLIFQYEVFIAHSVADGDQSYHYWRRLGDVIGTLYALGYHDRVDDGEHISDFRKDLRRAALARVYSADKNVALFLGRPLRLQLRYCRSQLPLLGVADVSVIGDSSSAFRTRWPSIDEFDYMTETRWSALCAMLKELIMNLSEEQDDGRKWQQVQYGESVAQTASIANGCSEIRTQAKVLRLDLPPRFRWDGAVKDLQDRKAIEQDFMISARLNHLHIEFLLGLASAQNMAEPQSDLVSTADTMLRLAVDAVVLKDRLIDSGTSLVWKIAHYGLPAAGVLCLSLLNDASPLRRDGHSMVDMVRRLSVLVAQIEAGVLVDPSDPNYALFAKASQAIDSVLHRVITRSSTSNAASQSSDMAAVDSCLEWMPWSGTQNTYDFELDFWLNLGEHPGLTLPNNGSAEMDGVM